MTGASVVTAAFSPDGTRVATGSHDGSARVFDPATGIELARLDHDGTVFAVAFSPDGTRVATGSEDGSARVFGATPDLPYSAVTRCNDLAAERGRTPPIFATGGFPAHQAME